MIKKRLLPCVIIVVLTVGCVILSRPTRMLFFMALALASVFELKGVLGEAGIPFSRVLMCIYVIGQGLLCWLRMPVLWMVALFGVVAFVIFFWAVLTPKTGARFAVGGLFSLMWPFGFYAIIFHAAASAYWLPTLAISILGAWVCDCMALLGGTLIGKHKLAPEVSPKKTWEGAIIGGLFSVLAGWLIYLILQKFAPVPMIPCMVITFVASTFGQIGDLAASLVKRMAGVKDYGHIMPEHGGIMDKMDSMLFAIPTAYLGLYIMALFL